MLEFAVHLEPLKRLNLFTILTTDYITIYRHGKSESFDMPDVLWSAAKPQRAKSLNILAGANVHRQRRRRAGLQNEGEQTTSNSAG